MTYATGRDLAPLPAAESFEAVVGEGVRGVVEGHEVFVGVGKAEGDGAGASGSLVSIDGVAAGRIQFRDEPKPDAAATVRELSRDFAVTSYMVTGDAAPTARAIAEEVASRRPRVRRCETAREGRLRARRAGRRRYRHARQCRRRGPRYREG
ncbi:MAG: hypothetical protein ACLUW6_04080 [Coriobacteriaceae bacterium]